MDPIAAWMKQQERNQLCASSDKADFQLRAAHPRWVTIFESLAAVSDGFVQIDGVIQGFSMILGPGAALVPQRQIKQVFADLDVEAKGGLNFKGFCELSKNVSSYMMSHPKWAEEEATKDEEERKQRLQLDKEKRRKDDGLDLLEVLGVTKSKELRELEDRKRQALINNNSAREARLARLKSVGNSVIMAQRFTSALKRSRANRSNFNTYSSNGSSVMSAQSEEEPEPNSPTKKIRDTWERFSLSSVPGTASRVLKNARQVHLPDHLPQIRALGKSSVGCVQLRFSPDCSQLAGGFFDGGVRFFDIDEVAQSHCVNLPASKGGTTQSKEEKVQIESEDVDLFYVTKKWEPVTNLCWQPGGSNRRVLASIDTKGALLLWDVPHRKEKRPPRCLGAVSTGSSLLAAAFSCNGRTLAVGGDERVVKLYDVERDFGRSVFAEGRELGKGPTYGDKRAGHALRIVSICAHPTQPEILISVGLDRQILLWDTRASSNLPVSGICGPELAGDAADIGKDGITLLAGSHRSKNPIEIYDLRMTEHAKPVSSYEWRANELQSEGGGKYTMCQLFSAGWDEFENKTIVAAGENENLARVFERPSDPQMPLRVVGTLRGKDIAFLSSAVSADARKAAFGSADGAVSIVDISMQQSAPERAFGAVQSAR